MSGEAAASARSLAEASVERNSSALSAVSSAVHGSPELCFEEHRSAALVAAALDDGGMSVETGVFGLETAIRATAGNGPLSVVICAEYDALPDVGHACGHNLIAAAAIGAGLALAEVADEIGISVTVLGTPAEEGGGGKILMLERGAFDGAHFSMMVHPWPNDRLGAACLAVDHLRVRYKGKEAHASAAPERGINAGDALVVSQVAIGLLRQQLSPGDQVHGIVESGGQAPNIIPGEAYGRWMVRSGNLQTLQVLRKRIERCFEAGAIATGAELSIEELSPTYSHFESDSDILEIWKDNAAKLGRAYPEDDAGVPMPTVSTDMANVSLAVPSIHPLIGIESNGAVNHQHEFAAACIGPSAEKAIYDGALGMAWTAIDVAANEPVRQRLIDRRLAHPAL